MDYGSLILTRAAILMKSIFPPAMNPESIMPAERKLFPLAAEFSSPRPAKPCAGNPKGKPGKPFDMLAIPGKPARKAPGKPGNPFARFGTLPYSPSSPSPESREAVPFAGFPPK